MSYLDQYVRIAAENFEKELARVAKTDEQAKKIHENKALQDLLNKIEKGEITPPSDAFEGFHIWFQTDAKFCNSWASDLYYKKEEKQLFNAVADLSNVLSIYKNDMEFSDYCRRIGYVFSNGWPNNPELYAETVKQAEQEKIAKSVHAPSSKFEQWLSRLIRK